MAAETVDLPALAAAIADEKGRELGLQSAELPEAVHDGYFDLLTGISDQIGAGRQLEADLAELRERRDLIPQAGWLRLRNEAVAEAKARHDDAHRRAAAAFERIRDALEQAALPTLDPAREQLARQELAVAIGEARDPAVILSRIARLAQTPSREACAVLFTTFGQTLLESRGLAGRDYTETMTTARQIAAASAVTHGTSAREITAGRALANLDALSPAIGAAGSFALQAISEAER